MKLTTRSRYGTRLIMDIALCQDQGPVRIADVSKRQGISVKYLEKLIRVLKRGGYVRSRRGPSGGHVLAKRPDEITIGELVRVLEGTEGLVVCEVNGGPCPRMPSCKTHQIWQDASEAMYGKLDKVTVADLILEEATCADPTCPASAD